MFIWIKDSQNRNNVTSEDNSWFTYKVFLNFSLKLFSAEQQGVSIIMADRCAVKHIKSLLNEKRLGNVYISALLTTRVCEHNLDSSLFAYTCMPRPSTRSPNYVWCSICTLFSLLFLSTPEVHTVCATAACDYSKKYRWPFDLVLFSGRHLFSIRQPGSFTEYSLGSGECGNSFSKMKQNLPPHSSVTVFL